MTLGQWDLCRSLDGKSYPAKPTGWRLIDKTEQGWNCLNKSVDILRKERWQEAKAANDEIANRKVAIPEGKFETLVVDPPWEAALIRRTCAPNQLDLPYPTMNEHELVEFRGTIDKLAAENSHLFLWTTHKHLPLALRLLDHWKFKYVLIMVWYKPGGFQPFGLPQYNCEFVLYSHRGTPKFIDTKAFFTCFEAPRREHSRKPDEFYDVIRRVTAGPRIDIFSREQRHGFAQFGNETDKFGAAANE
jgi:N6-adenosine-specific RNA methylase IME4